MLNRLNTRPSTPSPAEGPLLDTAAEVGVRQLLASGHDKAALKRAKDIHQAQGTVASEALLVDAYMARIQALLRQDLAPEADRMIALVRQRHPSARTHLDELLVCRQVRAGSLDAAVAPLGDPALSAERRAAIERAIQRELRDLSALAACTTLAPDDPLRAAAVALDLAFTAVTSGPVEDVALDLPEVSRRSPLAPWKVLVRAIAAFYRGDDATAERYLDAVPSDSAPARLVPAIRAASGQPSAQPVSTAARTLAARIVGDPVALRDALDAVDRAFTTSRPDRMLAAIRTATDLCRHTSPGQLERLKQHIAVQCALAELNVEHATAAMGGASHHDAYFLRLFARTMEESDAPEHLVLACSLWAQFQTLAVKEGWFAPNGLETATLCLHIADLLQRLPPDALRELQRSAGPRHTSAAEDPYFLFPETLYQRACAFDPGAEAFSQWMAWATEQPRGGAERIAEAWHRIRPQDLAPVLHLMEAAERVRQFDAALKYLSKAEHIDGVHPDVRGARLRLMAGRAIRHIQFKKISLAEQEVEQLTTIPQAQQGDRPALVAALRVVVSLAAGSSDITAPHADVECLLESRIAAALLIHAVSTASKRALWTLPPVEAFTAAERAGLPAAVARVMALAADVRLALEIPVPWMVEAAKRFAKHSPFMAPVQLIALAQAALYATQFEFAYAISTVGLSRAGDTEARFLMLRARSLPDRLIERRAVCALAAAALARRQRETDLVKTAVDLSRTISGFEAVSLTPEQAAEVVRRETVEAAWPSGRRQGPDYGDLVERACMCPDCRQARGEMPDDEDLLAELPPDVPPELARLLLAETKTAVARGESLEELLARLPGGPRPGKRRKGRRR